jgi:hypothetical protein
MSLPVAQDLGVDAALDLLRCSRVSGRVCEKSKRRRSGADERALLGDVAAEHRAQGVVQQVGRAVVAADRGAALGVDLQLERVADPERAARRACRGARAGRRSA